MSDSLPASRAEKLNAARKKLKEYQEQKKLRENQNQSNVSIETSSSQKDNQTFHSNIPTNDNTLSYNSVNTYYSNVQPTHNPQYAIPAYVNENIFNGNTQHSTHAYVNENILNDNPQHSTHAYLNENIINENPQQSPHAYGNENIGNDNPQQSAYGSRDHENILSVNSQHSPHAYGNDNIRNDNLQQSTYGSRDHENILSVNPQHSPHGYVNENIVNDNPQRSAYGSRDHENIINGNVQHSQHGYVNENILNDNPQHSLHVSVNENIPNDNPEQSAYGSRDHENIMNVNPQHSPHISVNENILNDNPQHSLHASVNENILNDNPQQTAYGSRDHENTINDNPQYSTRNEENAQNRNQRFSPENNIKLNGNEIPNVNNPNETVNTASPNPSNETANYNILAVFTDSSNNSSFCSSTNTGPFLSNESPLRQNVMNGHETDGDNSGDQQMKSKPNGQYHLFEQKHNDNYLGINFGHEGPGIHMNVSPFEHRNKQFVNDFLDALHESSNAPSINKEPNPSQENYQQDESNNSEENSKSLQAEDPNKPINLLNDNFRRNLLSLSTSKSTSIEDYTDKSRGNSVSKSISLESSNAINFDDMKPFRTDSNSSTIFSSCDNIRKLSSSANESSSEPPCTNSQCEENLLIELEKRNDELSHLLHDEQKRTDALEATVTQMKYEINSLHEALTEKDKFFESNLQQYEQQMKSQTHTIQILIEEKNQLERKVNETGDIVENKNKEIDELKGRLAISKHKSANIERDVNLFQEQIKANNATIQELNAALAQERKQIDDLSDDKVELIHKLDSKTKELNHMSIALQERDSQLSLLHLKVQQLSAASGMLTLEDNSDIKQLQMERDQLRHKVVEQSEHLKIWTRERDKTVQYHTQMIDNLKVKLDELATKSNALQNEKLALQTQNQSQIQHISELEKQIQSLRENVTSAGNTHEAESAMKSLITEMESKIKELTLEKQKLDTSLQAQVLENELAKEQIEQLAREIDKLEGDRPNASALLSAMESDKIAASRAVQQNNLLKQQLQELQDAVITLNNTKLELTEELESEKFRLKEIEDNLATLFTKYHFLNTDNINESEPNSAFSNVEIIRKLEQLDSKLSEVLTSKNQSNVSPCDSKVTLEINSSPAVQNEALLKLEEKFKQTMFDLAELSDEKQRLEHLVTQLQLETETIGEYATLYQKQRYLLQQKSLEKDEQVKRSAKEQEALKEKLAKLLALVQDFVKDKPYEDKKCLFAEHGVDLLNESNKDSVSPVTDSTHHFHDTNSPQQDTKATEILALISEIGSNRLVDSSTSFHPCPVCYGQLITV